MTSPARESGRELPSTASITKRQITPRTPSTFWAAVALASVLGCTDLPICGRCKEGSGILSRLIQGVDLVSQVLVCLLVVGNAEVLLTLQSDGRLCMLRLSPGTGS